MIKEIINNHNNCMMNSYFVICEPHPSTNYIKRFVYNINEKTNPRWFKEIA